MFNALRRHLHIDTPDCAAAAEPGSPASSASVEDGSTLDPDSFTIRDSRPPETMRVPPLVIQAAANRDAAAVRRLSANAPLARHLLPYCPEGLGMTALLAGVLNGDLDTVRAAVCVKEVIEVRHDVMGWTALMYAVSRSDPDMVRLLLNCGADPLAEGFDGLTAVHLARSAADESVEGRAILALLVDANAA